MTPMTPAPDQWVGHVLPGDFKILRPLGQGGMGAVFLAEQLGMDRKVVIKFIRAELSSHPVTVERFRREARAVAQLNHPNVVQVYVAGAADDGALYVAMEFVDGRPLTADMIPGRRFGSRRALHIIEQVCGALGEAHGAGIVHRDLKPDNIMLCERNKDRDFVKLLDFGIAKQQERDGEDKGLRTEAGLIHGTPRYMSPEQARAVPVDARSDLYSIGIVLYELLTGANPYGEQTSMAYVFKHAAEPAPTPSTLDPSLRLAPRLEAMLMRCLAKDPAGRFGSAEELRNEVLEMLRILPVGGDSVSTTTAQAGVSDAARAAANAVWAPTEAMGTGGADTEVAQAVVAAVAPAVVPADSPSVVPAVVAVAAPLPQSATLAALAPLPMPLAPPVPAAVDATTGPTAAGPRRSRSWQVLAGFVAVASVSAGLYAITRERDPFANAPILPAGPDIEGLPAPAGAVLSSATEQIVAIETGTASTLGVLRFYRDRLTGCGEVTLEGAGLRIKDAKCAIGAVMPMQLAGVNSVSILRNTLMNSPPKRAQAGDVGAFGVPLMAGAYQSMRTAKNVVYVVDAAPLDVIEFYDRHYRGKPGVHIDRQTTSAFPMLTVTLVATPGHVSSLQVTRDTYRPNDPKWAQVSVSCP